MSGIEAVQTVTAIFDLLKIAWKAGVFLDKVRKADRVASEVYEKVQRLTNVLEGVRAVLQKRDSAVLSPAVIGADAVETRLKDSILSCQRHLSLLEDKVGGFDTKGSAAKLLDKFRIACKSSSIAKRQIDLEARISILQTDLVVLQLFDHARTDTLIHSNQTELRQVLQQLGEQVANGNRLLASLHQQTSAATAIITVPEVDHVENVQRWDQDTTISSLVECLRAAEDVHERFTADYEPDDRSVQAQGRLMRATQTVLPSSTLEENPTERVYHWADGVEDESVLASSLPREQPSSSAPVMPLRFLDQFIANHRELARVELDKGHFKQAEKHLDEVVRHSQARADHYGVEFKDGVQVAESLAVVYRRQEKWANAIAKVRELLREGSLADEAENFRSAHQFQLLADIYYDRYCKRPSDVADLEVASVYAHKAFKVQHDLLHSGQGGTGNSEDQTRHAECIQLLVNVLQADGKTVEADVFRQLLIEVSPGGPASLRRTSTSASNPMADYEVIEDRHELLISALKGGDLAQIQNPDVFLGLDVDKCCGPGAGRTLLMHAVQASNQSAVSWLLEVGGADVDARNRKGQTALHIAAFEGHHDVLRCLLSHDADKESKNNDGETPLVMAVKGNHLTIVQDLCENNGVDMYVKSMLGEWSALHSAIDIQNTEMVILLLDLAPDLKDAIDQAGMTALHRAVEHEKLEHVEALLQHRNHVDINVADSTRRNALYFAASKPVTSKRQAVVQMLVEKGAVIDANRPPPRMRDYSALRPFVISQKGPTRHDSVSTDGSIGTVSSGASKMSRVLARWL